MRFAFIAAEKAAHPGAAAVQGAARSRGAATTRGGGEIRRIEPPRTRSCRSKIARHSCASRASVREPAGSRGSWSSRGLRGRTQTCGSADAARLGLAGCQAAARSRATTDSKHASPDRGQRPGSRVRGDATEPDVGHRHHVHLDGRGLAVPGGRPRSVLATRRGLVDGRELGRRASRSTALAMALGRRQPDQGLDPPLGSRGPVRQR